MRLRLRSSRRWLHLFRCIGDGITSHPGQTLRHVWTINPFVHKTWRRFSLRVHGEKFLADFFAASREAGIKPFLMWGTLLGYVREGGLLKHDRDIDVGILAGDWTKRDLLIAGMLRRGYELAIARDYKVRFTRRDKIIHLDVDVFFPWDGKMVCFDIQKNDKLVGAWFPLDAFDNFRKAVFLNLEVLVPDPPERILETAYGDWKTPVTAYHFKSIPNWLHVPPGADWPRIPGSGI